MPWPCIAPREPTALHGHGMVRGMVRRAHDMLVRLDRLYKIYHVEPNTVYSDGTCIEFAFERRELCGMDGKASV